MPSENFFLAILFQEQVTFDDMMMISVLY